MPESSTTDGPLLGHDQSGYPEEGGGGGGEECLCHFPSRFLI